VRAAGALDGPMRETCRPVGLATPSPTRTTRPGGIIRSRRLLPPSWESGERPGWALDRRDGRSVESQQHTGRIRLPWWKIARRRPLPRSGLVHPLKDDVLVRAFPGALR
jgi:hypothetical protein